MEPPSKKDFIYEKGDRVYYNAKVEGDTDTYTKGLIDLYLIHKNIYTIVDMRHSDVYCDHYRFLETSTNDYWFPVNCFVPILDRKYIEDKYGLK